MLRLIAATGLLLMLTACAPAPPRAAPADLMPPLRLAPETLGRDLALQQRLLFKHGERADSIDALVEADATSLRLVMHTGGQVALRLEWDGERLTQTRADWLPVELSGARVLDDLQLVFWPAERIAAALPAPWRLEDRPGRRRLFKDGVAVATVSYAGETHVLLEQHRLGYTLDIHSVPVRP